MSDDLDFFYSGGLAPKPSKKNGWREKVKNLIKNLPGLLSRKERYLVLGLSFLVIASLISIPVGFYFSVTEAAPDYGGSFSEGLIGEPRFINPLLLQTDTDRDLAQLVFSGLLKNDGHGKLVPDLAETFAVSEDGLTYGFILRNDVKWHDGRKFTADDVLFTVTTAQNQDFSSPQMINWRGVEAVKTGEFALEFRLKNPYAQFANNLTLGILPSHLWRDVKPSNFILSELNLKPVGTGPYQSDKLRKNRTGRIDSYELTSNENYHLGEPFIERIKFKFFLSEEDAIQGFNLSGVEGIGGISALNINGLRFPGKVEIRNLKIPRYFSVFFNQNQSEPVSDKNVRLALAHSVNKDKILETIGGNGLKIDSPILPEIFDDFNRNIKIYDFNPEFSKQILDNSGWKDSDGDGILDKNGKKLELTLVVPSRNEQIKVSEQLERDWEGIGAAVNLAQVGVSELQQNYIQPRSYEMLLFGEVLNLDPDPFSFWHSSQKKDPGLNLALYDNKGADKLLEEARQALNPVARISKYNDFQNLVIEDLSAIFLYSTNFIYAKPKKVKGFEDELLGLPSERFVNVHKWYIETQRNRK